MSEPTDHDEPDDVEGHRFLTPEQAQQRAEDARRQGERRADPAAGSGDADS